MSGVAAGPTTDAGRSRTDVSSPGADAGATSPCPELQPEDQGFWQWLEPQRLCVYSNRRSATTATYVDAERRCQELGGVMPRISDLEPLCGDLLFRQGATNRGRQVWTSVWVADACGDGRHRSWKDSSYEDDGTACRARSCVSDDAKKYYGCLKRIP